MVFFFFFFFLFFFFSSAIVRIIARVNAGMGRGITGAGGALDILIAAAAVGD